MPNNIIAKHQRGNSEFVKNLPIVDGQKVYNTETGEEFLDIGKERIPRHKDLKALTAANTDLILKNGERIDNIAAQNWDAHAEGMDIVSLDDVSPTEHQVGCKVERINMAPSALFDEKNWVQYNGMNYIFPIELPPGTYFLSGSRNEPLVSAYVYLRRNDGEVLIEFIKSTEPVKENSFTVNPGDTVHLWVGSQLKRIKEIKTIQINRGAEKLPYTPYIPDLSKVTVSRLGPQLFNQSDTGIADGFLNADGSLAAVSGGKTSGYIPVVPDLYLCVAGREATGRCKLYDSTKNVLSASSDKDVLFSEGLNGKSTLPIPSRAAFFRFSYLESDTPRIMVNCGNPLPHEPYAKTDFTPSPSGLVSGMTSIPGSKVMNVISDTPGLKIDLDYSSNANAKIDNDIMGERNAYSNQYSNGIFAPALINTVEGEVIAVDDVSPLEHSVGCKVERVNIFNPADAIPSEAINRKTGNQQGAGKNWACTDFLQVKPDTDYFVPWVNQFGDFGYAFYDEEKNYISGTNLTTEFHTPPTAKWCRLTIFALEHDINDFWISTTNTTGQTYIPDLSKVKVSRTGKNCLSIEKMTEGFSQRKFIDFENRRCVYYIDDKVIMNKVPNFQYTISFDGKSTGVNAEFFRIYYTDGSIGTIRSQSEDWKHYSDTTEAQKEISTIGIGSVRGMRMYIDIDTFQIERSSVETPYESYNGQTLTPSPSGIVSGMTSLSPNMTVLTDTPGVIIDATYGQDTKTVVGKQNDRITALEEQIVKLLPPASI